MVRTAPGRPGRPFDVDNGSGWQVPCYAQLPTGCSGQQNGPAYAGPFCQLEQDRCYCAAVTVAATVWLPPDPSDTAVLAGSISAVTPAGPLKLTVYSPGRR